MNTVSKLMVMSYLLFAVLFAKAEIDGSGFYSLDCEGTITTVFMERSEGADDFIESGTGISDIKVAISMIGAPELGVSIFSSDESGRIEFTNLCPGLYRVEVGQESIPEGLEYVGVSSGAGIWSTLPKLLPLELNVSGVRNEMTTMDFELWYLFSTAECDGDYTRPECGNYGHSTQRSKVQR